MTEQERLEDEMVVEALCSVGVRVTSTQDLMRTREPYPTAIKVLVEMLGKVKTYMLKEIITRSLATKEAKGHVESVLINELDACLDDDGVEAKAFRWAIANTLEVIGGRGDVDSFLRLLRDPRTSNARGMLALAAAKTKDKRFVPIFLEYLDSEKLQGFAACGLGILRAEDAAPKLKELAAKTPNSWVRREALTALRRMGVDAAIPKIGEKKPAKPKRNGSGSGSEKANSQERRSTVVTGSDPLGERLSVLAECGIGLSPTITPDALTSRIPHQGPEKDSYQLLLCALGEEAEADSEAEYTGYLSDNIWHFNTECIEDHGAYAVIAQRMAELAQGDLPLQDIDDYVDVEEGEAWLAFTLEGRPYKWVAKVDDDWVDPSIFSRFAGLLASRKVGKRFIYINLGGQDCLIGCATPEQRACLETKTGLKVEWLE